MADPNDLGKALAPDPEVFEVVDETDPLSSTKKTESPGDELIDLSMEMPEFGAPLDPINDIDVVEPGEPALPPVDPSLTGEAEEVTQDDWSVAPTNIQDPAQLVAAVLSKAREFVSYREGSRNSSRRAIAFCDGLERMIIAGVTGDADEQKLSLAQLELLDSIEEGIQITKAALEKASQPKTVAAGMNKEARLEQIYYDPFCATVARILINAQVSGGKKIQDIYAYLKTKHNIDEREALQISQIMGDMGYPIRSLLDGRDMIEQFYC